MKESVEIKRSNFNMAGELYLPEGMDESKKYPAIVVVHPGGGVKEQTAGLYAEKLSELGYITLAFDASYQGESGGEPRFLEDPSARVEDVSWAVDYLATNENVDSERIGVLGICAGGGYSVNAAGFDRRIKAVGTVSGIDIGGLFRASFGENPAPAIIQLLESVGNQRTEEAKGADFLTIPYVPNSPEEFNENTPEYAKEAYDYYRTPRAMYPTSENKMLFRSIPKIMSYNAFSQVGDFLTQPIVMIVGKNADTAYFSENTINEIKTDHKELYWIDGATHVSLYDVPEHVNKAVAKLKEFYGRYL